MLPKGLLTTRVRQPRPPRYTAWLVAAHAFACTGTCCCLVRAATCHPPCEPPDLIWLPVPLLKQLRHLSCWRQWPALCNVVGDAGGCWLWVALLAPLRLPAFPSEGIPRSRLSPCTLTQTVCAHAHCAGARARLQSMPARRAAGCAGAGRRRPRHSCAGARDALATPSYQAADATKISGQDRHARHFHGTGRRCKISAAICICVGL